MKSMKRYDSQEKELETNEKVAINTCTHTCKTKKNKLTVQKFSIHHTTQYATRMLKGFASTKEKGI